MYLISLSQDEFIKKGEKMNNILSILQILISHKKDKILKSEIWHKAKLKGHSSFNSHQNSLLEKKVIEFTGDYYRNSPFFKINKDEAKKWEEKLKNK
jgi:hypothetical protein